MSSAFTSIFQWYWYLPTYWFPNGEIWDGNNIRSYMDAVKIGECVDRFGICVYT